MEEIKSIDAGQSRKSATRTADIKKYSFILSKKLTIKDLAGFRTFIDGLPQAFQSSQLRQAALESLKHLYTNTTVSELILKYINLIFDYVEKAQTAFEEYKDKQHLIDFTDMEARFVELLDKKEVQDDIRNTYKYVFVDEFQDSSPIQVQIFGLTTLQKLRVVIQKPLVPLELLCLLQSCHRLRTLSEHIYLPSSR